SLGEDHPEYAASLNNLAVLYRSMGRYSDAEPLFRQATEIWRKSLGEDHPNCATGLNNLAELYRSVGRYSDAEPLFR
ncbi:tetratricopeptide repeat protein, partial [Methanosaeta sp. UBA356]